MSFVLDALKRSEQDRNQGQIPDLSNQGTLLHLNKSKSSVWPYVLIAVLVLNAVVFLFIHFSDDSPRPEPAVSLQSSKNELSLAEDPVMSSVPVPSVRPIKSRSLESTAAREDIYWAEKARRAKNLIEQELYARRNGSSSFENMGIDGASFDGAGFNGIGIETSEGLRIDPRVQSEGTPMAYLPTEDDLDLIHPTQDANSSLLMPDETRPAERTLTERIPRETFLEKQYRDVPFLFEIPSVSRPSIPHIKFTSHIYSDSPSARRIMINNIYLREGESLSGMEILEIGERNVVFRQGKTLFKLPAMRDWNG